MPLRWTLHYHPSVISYIYSVREQAALITPTIVALQDNSIPDVAAAVKGRIHTYQIDVENGYSIQYEVIAASNVVKVLWVGETRDLPAAS